MCEGMGSLVRLQPKSVIVAFLIAAKQPVGNDLVVSFRSYEANELSKGNGGGNCGN